MKHKNIILFIAAGLIIFLSIPSFSFNSWEQAGFIKHENKESGFSIKAPKDWKFQKERKVGGEKESADPFSTLTSPGSGNDVVNFSIIVSPAKGRSGEEYIKSLLFSYSKSFKKFEFESKDALSINGYSYASFVINHDIQDKPYKMLTLFTIHNDTIYQVNAIAPPEKFEAEKKTIYDIVNTFEIEK